MATIMELEKLLEPYKDEADWGGSDEFGNTYQGYKNGEASVRIDSGDWDWLFVRNPRKAYKSKLVEALDKLGIPIPR